LDKESIEELLREINPGAKLDEINGWVSCSCPLAEWTHEKGSDSSPSFGIRIDPEGISRFNCFTCHQHGDLPKLLKKLSRYTGEDYSSMISSVEVDDLLGGPLPEWGKKQKRAEKLGEPVDENLVYAYEEARGHPYLRDRGVSNSVVDQFGIVIDPDNRGATRILIPVRHVTGELYGFIGRATDDYTNPKVRDYNGLPKRLLLLGMNHAINDNRGYTILVEGPFDALRLWSLGYPAVAAMHSTLTDAQAAILRNHARSLIVLFDNDQAGREGRNVVAEKMKKYMPVLKTAYPKGYNDPGELNEKHMRRMIAHTKLI
jgi:DNA primase